MPKTVKDDLSGKVFGRYLVLEFVPDDSDYAKFLCRCECGTEKIVMSQSLKKGATMSCGCYSRDSALRNIVHGHNRPGNRNPTYGSWASMMDRCEWGGHRVMYARYGARGIHVCNRWHEYKNFLEDMGERPLGASIDRIDNSKGYFKENCRWATSWQQSRNTSRNIFIVYKGQTIIATDLCKKLGINPSTIRTKARRMSGDYVAAFMSVGIECELSA